MATAALAAAGTKLPAAAVPARPNLRVGVLSDPHVTGFDNAQWMAKAFKYFAERHVDAVLITGDIGTSSYEKDWAVISKTWFDAFPNDALPDGSPVVRLFLTGNHDLDDWAYHGDAKAKRLKIKDRAENRAFSFHRQELWRKYWHEDYEPIFVKTVKGYTFILRNWLSKRGLEIEDQTTATGGRPLYVNENAPLAEALAKARVKDAGRPFFYCQHDLLRDTVNATHLLGGGRWNSDEDDGYARSFLDKYPNCLAITGHSHFSLTDEMSIWQGPFTAVNASCARGFAFTKPGRENGFSGPDFRRVPPFEMARFDHNAVRQFLVMEVFDDRIVFERHDLTYGGSLGEDWVVPLYAGGATVPPAGTPKYDFKTRCQAARPPAFAPGASVKVSYVAAGHRRTADGFGALDTKETHPQVCVTFPPIVRGASSPARAFDFKVTCSECVGDVETVVQERRVFSPNFAQAESRDTVPCTCLFPHAALPPRRTLRFTVTPYDCWGKAGTPISTVCTRPS